MASVAILCFLTGTSKIFAHEFSNDPGNFWQVVRELSIVSVLADTSGKWYTSSVTSRSESCCSLRRAVTAFRWAVSARPSLSSPRTDLTPTGANHDSYSIYSSLRDITAEKAIVHCTLQKLM